MELLQERMEEACAIGRSDKVGAFLEPCDFRQLKALNTALPIGGRQVDYMRFFLTSSLVAFNPYHAQDILEPGGKMLGINKTTGRYLIANRKLLPNSRDHCGIFRFWKIHADQADRDFPDLAWKRR